MRHISSPALLGRMEWRAGVSDTNSASFRGGVQLGHRQWPNLCRVIKRTNVTPYMYSSTTISGKGNSSCQVVWTMVTLSLFMIITVSSLFPSTPAWDSTLGTCISMYLLELQRGQNVDSFQGGRIVAFLRNLLKSQTEDFPPSSLPPPFFILTDYKAHRGITFSLIGEFHSDTKAICHFNAFPHGESQRRASSATSLRTIFKN